MTGVIFDFNGTLFHDSKEQETAWNTFSSKTFGRDISDEEFKNIVHGRNNDKIMEYLAGKPLSAEQVDVYVETKETIYRDLCRSNPARFHLAPGAARLLDELKERQIPRTIATASRKSNVEFYIDSFHLDTWFDTDKIIFDDGTIPGKPNPDFYLRAAEAIGMPPENCIVFEDAVSGLLAAYNAGSGRVIAVAAPEHQAEFRQMKEVTDVIADYSEFDRALLNR